VERNKRDEAVGLKELLLLKGASGDEVDAGSGIASVGSSHQ
jgi:hypothetical protein